MTQLQELLGKILRSRIEREKADGTIDGDKVNLSQTLDIFMASNKITSEQYSEFTELITPKTDVKDAASNDKTAEAASQTTAS